MSFTLYILICPIGKGVRYVGLTTQSLESRLSRHLSDDKKRNPHKYNWIQILKKNNLEPRIKLVAENLTEEEACKREIELIAVMRGIVGKKLTNHHDGGTLPPNWDGRKHSIQTKKKLGKAVFQLKTNGQIIKRYYSITEAAKETNVSRTSIVQCCRKNRKTAGGFLWRYA